MSDHFSAYGHNSCSTRSSVRDELRQLKEYLRKNIKREEELRQKEKEFEKNNEEIRNLLAKLVETSGSKPRIVPTISQIGKEVRVPRSMHEEENTKREEELRRKEKEKKIEKKEKMKKSIEKVQEWLENEKQQPTLLEKSKEDNVSSKGLMLEESHFPIENDLTKTFFIHQDLNSFSHVATSHEVEIQKQILFKEKESQLQDLVKKKWTSLSPTSCATSLVVPKEDKPFFFKTLSTLVFLIKHPTFELYDLLDTSHSVLFSIFDLEGSSNLFGLNLVTSLQDKFRLYEFSRLLFTPFSHMYLTNNAIQSCLGNFLVKFSLFSSTYLGHHIGYLQQDILVFRTNALVCYSFSLFTFLGFGYTSRLHHGEDPIFRIRESSPFSLDNIFSIFSGTPLRIHFPFLSYTITSNAYFFVFVGHDAHHEEPLDLRSNPFQEGGNDGITLRPRTPRGDVLKEAKGMG